MSDQLALYLDGVIEQCSDFTEFEARGFSFEKGQALSTVTITDFKITVDVRFPIKVIKADRTQELRRFLFDFPVPLGHMRKTASEMVEDIKLDPKNIDFQKLFELGYNVTFFPADTKTIVYVLAEPDTPDPMVFQFGVVYEVGSPPSFEAPDKFVIPDGEPFFRDLEATDPDGGVEGEDLVFSDDTGMFDIVEDGKILFVPEIPGATNVTITVTDPEGLSYSKQILFEVVE